MCASTCQLPGSRDLFATGQKLPRNLPLSAGACTRKCVAGACWRRMDVSDSASKFCNNVCFFVVVLHTGVRPVMLRHKTNKLTISNVCVELVLLFQCVPVGDRAPRDHSSVCRICCLLQSVLLGDRAPRDQEAHHFQGAHGS
jgi:hypothetical protein